MLLTTDKLAPELTPLNGESFGGPASGDFPPRESCPLRRRARYERCFGDFHCRWERLQAVDSFDIVRNFFLHGFFLQGLSLFAASGEMNSVKRMITVRSLWCFKWGDSFTILFRNLSVTKKRKMITSSVIYFIPYKSYQDRTNLRKVIQIIYNAIIIRRFVTKSGVQFTSCFA